MGFPRDLVLNDTMERMMTQRLLHQEKLWKLGSHAFLHNELIRSTWMGLTLSFFSDVGRIYQLYCLYSVQSPPVRTLTAGQEV